MLYLQLQLLRILQHIHSPDGVKFDSPEKIKGYGAVANIMHLIRHQARTPQGLPLTSGQNSATAESSEPMRIGLFGNFGTGNFGNDGSLQAWIEFLRARHPDTQLCCICPNEKRVNELFNLSTLPIEAEMPKGSWFRILNRILPHFGKRLHHFVSTFRAVGRFDAIIVPGTGILDDFADRWQGMPLSLFIWGLAARLRRRPFAFVSIGAGPIEHPWSRWLMKWAARMAHFRSFRNQESRTFVEGLGIDTSGDPVTPDITFSLSVPTPAADLEAGNDSLPIIGIGVMSYAGWHPIPPDSERIYGHYIAKIAQFAGWLLYQGYGVRIIPGDDNDAGAVDDIVVMLTKQFGSLPGHLAAEKATSMEDVISQMADTKVVIATRFHNIICALKSNIPVISIGYAKKNDVLLSAMGLQDFCQHIEDLDVGLLKNQFERLLRDSPFYKVKITEKNAEYRAELLKQDERLLEWLLTQKKGRSG
jgi:polysaccharide pyruvyl transferase WcaK-like protein